MASSDQKLFSQIKITFGNTLDFVLFMLSHSFPLDPYQNVKRPEIKQRKNVVTRINYDSAR